jgi:hypothetical protein
MSLSVLAQNITPEYNTQIKHLPQGQRIELANLVKSKLDDDYLKSTIPPQIINLKG